MMNYQLSAASSSSSSAIVTLPRTHPDFHLPELAEENRDRNLPCAVCRKGKRRCKWMAGGDSCERCFRVGVKCSGPSDRPMYVKRAQERKLQTLNLAPSNSNHVLERGTLAVALVYELVRAYKDQMRGISYTDPEAERWRLGVLKETGQIANLGDIGELKMLIYLVGGAKLSTHSALIGLQGSALAHEEKQSLNSDDEVTTWSADRHRLGFLRQSVLQDLSARLIPLVGQLVNSMAEAHIRDDLALMWVALGELGSSAADPVEVRNFMHEMSPRTSKFLLTMPKEVLDEVWVVLDRVMVTDPSIMYYGFLAEGDSEAAVADEQVVPTQVFKFFDRESTSAFVLLSDDERSHIIRDPHASDSTTRIIKSIQTSVLTQQKLLLKLLLYDPSPLVRRYSLFWVGLDETQTFFEEQARFMLEYWEREKLEGEDLPRGLRRFFRDVLKAQAVHVLFAWAGYRETSKRWNEVSTFKTRLNGALAEWADQVEFLMDNTSNPKDLYDISESVTQTLTFMRGSILTEWNLTEFLPAAKLSRVLRYASFSLPTAGRLLEEDMRTVVSAASSSESTSSLSSSPNQDSSSSSSSISLGGRESESRLAARMVVNTLESLE